MGLKLEEVVGKRLTEEQFDEAAGKKDACYHKVKARYDVWPSAYASGALVKCRKVGAKNWGNKSKKEGIEEKMRPAIKKALAQKGYGPIFNAIDTSKQQLKQLRYSRGEIQDTLIDMFGDEDPKILKKIKEGVDEKVLGGKDMTSGIDKNTKITFSKRLPTGYAYLAGKTFKVFKKGINTFNVVPDGSNSEKDARTLDAPTILKLVKNKNISKIVNSKGKVLSKEGLDDLKGLPKDLKKSIKKNREEGLGDKMSKKLKKHKGTKIKPIRLRGKSGMGKISHLGIESVEEARGTCWVGYQQLGMKRKGGKMVPNCVKEITELYYEIDGKGYGYTFEYINDGKLNEAEYQGRKVKLGKIMQGDVKKFKVYVKNPKGNVVKVNFGQGGKSASKTGGTMRIRKSNPKARANFRARHNCDNPGPRHKARYWACRTW